MKNEIKILAVCILGVILLVACNRNVDKELFAPKTVAVSSGFTLPGSTGFTTTVTSPSFSQASNQLGDSVSFRANFGQEASWQIKLVGQSSGAVKFIAGTSSYLDSTNNEWKGTTDNQIFFRSGEAVIAELSLLGAMKKYYDTLVIAKTLDYVAYNKGFLVANFNFPFSGATSGAYSPVEGKTLKDDYFYIKIEQTYNFQAIEGAGSVMYDGEDLENRSFIGGIYIQNANNATTSEPVVYVIDSLIDPSQIWINVFIYGVPNSSSQIDIAIKELDQKPGTPITHGDQWRSRFVLNWTGWKLVSVRYSDFSLTADSKGGNNEREPGKFHQFHINAGPNPNLPGGKVQFYVDFMTVTYGKPFQF